MSQQAIITIGYYRIMAPSVKAATDLVALLGRCTEVEGIEHTDDNKKVYKQKHLEVQMELINVVPYKAPAAPKSQPRRPRALPAPRFPGLPWRDAHEG